MSAGEVSVPTECRKSFFIWQALSLQFDEVSSLNLASLFLLEAKNN